MDISLPSVLLGVAAVAAVYFLSLVATKGLKAAIAFIKARVSTIESDLVSTVTKDVATLKTDMSAVKTKLGL